MQKMRMNNFIGTVVLLLMGLGASSSVMAVCQWVEGASAGMLDVRTNDITYNGTQRKIKLGGSLIPSSTFGVFNDHVNIMTCDDGAQLIRSLGDYSMANLDGGLVLKTNLHGVYLQVAPFRAWTFPHPTNGNDIVDITENRITPVFLSSNQHTGSPFFIDVYVLIGKGIKQGGTVSGGVLMKMGTSDGQHILDINIPSFTVTIPACTVIDSIHEVAMGDEASKDFPAVGSVSKTTAFDISIDCPGATMKPRMTFTGVTDDTAKTVFSNQGTAKQVGIQLLKDGEVVEPDKPVALGASTTGVNIFKFGARLYRLGTMKPGTIDVPVTFQMDYE